MSGSNSKTCYFCERKIELQDEFSDWDLPKNELFAHSFRNNPLASMSTQRYFCSVHCLLKQYPEKNTPFPSVITKAYLKKTHIPAKCQWCGESEGNQLYDSEDYGLICEPCLEVESS